jgi:Double zinc ribbon
VVGFALTGTEVVAIAAIIVLVVFIVGIFLYLARRLRARRDQLLGELKGRPELVQDRAYNRLAMARREAEILARTGADISNSQSLIAQSQAAFDLHDYARSYELAQTAHEGLVNARGTPPRSPPAVPTVSALPAHAVTASPLAPGAAPGPAPAPLPKNRAESHFLIGVLTQEVQRAPPGAGSTLEALALRDQAQAAFDRGDYGESFRLALRGRRALGGRIESLAATSTPPASAPLASVPDAGNVADTVAGAARCPDCGHPTLTDDVFCRGCGRPLGARTCPACGAPRKPTDGFCGRCGAPFPA